MARDSRYDVLFEPVQIGPVTAPNRFYQVPHCSGMGHVRPDSAASMRAVKAEGGWGVVSTEQCDIHHTSDITPYVEQKLWDDSDVPMHAKMVDAVHKHGALAAVELSYGGIESPNLLTRAVTVAPSAGPCPGYYPIYAREITKEDIRDILAIYRKGAARAMQAGFDIIYVYSAHALSLPTQFLSKKFNRRTDEYGGSLENRTRFLKEILEVTKDEVGNRCAVALRFSIDELSGQDGMEHDKEGIEVVKLLAELPDLWDVNISDWDNDSATSRFQSEGFQEEYISQVKNATSKPVVGVGRFTSPDTMVSQINRGILDFIGAARPSIADPFLPKKIEEGRIDDIRECIGCNICVTGDYTASSSRCTQNPTFGEEWRRGWHPEYIESAASKDNVLIVGAGPAGLECATWLGKRGFEVTLVDAEKTLGGRVNQESLLPGLSSWIRVRDYRIQQISNLGNVEVFPASKMSAQDIYDFGAKRVVVATGSRWRKDGLGRNHYSTVEIPDSLKVWTPDDFWGKSDLKGRVLIYDDDHFYTGGLIAELICAGGAETVLATTAPDVSHWTHYTLEQHQIQSNLLEMGVSIYPHLHLHSVADGVAEFKNEYTSKVNEIPFDHIVLVTSKISEDKLYKQIVSGSERLLDANLEAVDKIGDCLVPGTIAAAVYSGHKWARNLGESELVDGTPFLRELVAVSSS